MKHSILISCAVCLAAVDARPAEAAPTTATRLSKAHAAIAGAARKAIESHGAGLRGRSREAYGALVRGVFEYTLRLERLVTRAGGFGIGFRTALGETARTSLLGAIASGRSMGGGFVETVSRRWQVFLRGARAVLDFAGAPVVSRALEGRLHALMMNAQTIFYDAVHSSKGTVTALLSGFEPSLGPALRGAAALIRSDPKTARGLWEVAISEPNI